jgi:hypothetical protein
VVEQVRKMCEPVAYDRDVGGLDRHVAACCAHRDPDLCGGQRRGVAGLENQGRKPTTLHGYRKALDTYVLPRLGDVALQELRASDAARCTRRC